MQVRRKGSSGQGGPKPPTKPKQAKKKIQGVPLVAKAAGENTSVKQMERVMKSIMAPGLASDVRYNGAGVGGPTSLAQLTNPVDLEIDSAGDLLPAYESSAFVFRDPVRNLVFYDPNPGTTHAKYDLMFNRVSGDSDVVSQSWAGNPGPVSIAYALINDSASSTGFLPHGEVQGTGLANGNKTYIWSQENYVWAATYVSGPTDVLIRVYRWTPRGEIYVGQYTDTTSFTSIAGNGYVRFETFNKSSGEPSMNEVSGLQMSFTIPDGAGVFCQRPLVQYENKASFVEKVRILSQSILVTNLTPEISKGGKIASKQLPGDEPWYEYAFAGYNGIARLVHADIRAADEGMYGFLKPTAVEDYSMLDYVDSNPAGELIRFAFPLDSVRAYLGTYLVLPSTDGQNFQVVSATNIEFESDDQWFEQAEAVIPNHIFDMAVKAVSHEMQFDENPLHLQDILNAAKTAAKRAVGATLKYGPTVMKVAGLVASML
jgi:hypothetical protein